MNEQNAKNSAKKVKYITSIIYLVVLAFIVGGSYINQQQEIFLDTRSLSENREPATEKSLLAIFSSHFR